jgi:hypothetical protein
MGGDWIMAARLSKCEAKKYVTIIPSRKTVDEYNKPKRSKYRNVKTVVDGIKFDSKKEAERWLVLKSQQERAFISDLERQKRFALPIYSVGVLKTVAIVGHYVCDFAYKVDGNLVVEDCKGFKTPVYRLKKKLMKAIYGIDIREV